MAHEKLVLKELHLANEGKIASQTTLYMGSPSCGTACHMTSSSLGAHDLGVHSQGSGSGNNGGGSGSSGGGQEGGRSGGSDGSNHNNMKS